jgi:3-methyladenine DNA glycosylase AlkD
VIIALKKTNLLHHMNKTIEIVTKEITDSLYGFQEEKRKISAESNHPTKLEIIGVTNPNIKKVVTELRLMLKPWEQTDKKALLFYLTESNLFECHLLSYYFLEKEKKLLESLNFNEVKKLAACLDNWVLVDTYSTFILGYLWCRGLIKDNYIYSLLESENVWMRRTAIVSTVALNQTARGGSGDTLKTIVVCEKVAHEKHPMIVKALSWALRVLISTDRRAVIGFLIDHESILHNQIKREVNNKLNTGLKNPNK